MKELIVHNSHQLQTLIDDYKKKRKSEILFKTHLKKLNEPKYFFYDLKLREQQEPARI